MNLRFLPIVWNRKQLMISVNIIPISKSQVMMMDGNAINVINDLLPDESSCNTLASELLLRLKLKEKLLDEEIKDIIRGNSRNVINGTEELEIAKVEIKELFSRITLLKSKAQNSEQLVEKITKDLKSLDYAKKNLTSSISALKRFQMLVSGVEQIQILTKSRQYLEMSHLAQAVIELISFFEQYKKVLKVSLVLKDAQAVIDNAKSQACEEFFTKFSSIETNTDNKQVLVDACQLLDMIPSGKEKVIEWYIETQLKDYRQIFSPTSEIAGLDNTSRRYVFLKKIIGEYEKSHSDVFPMRWGVNEQLCLRFCVDTKRDLSQILSKTEKIDVKLMIKALKETTQLEDQLAKNVSYSKTNGFQRIISSCFEPYLTFYIEAEDMHLNEFVSGLNQSEVVVNPDDQHLKSGSDLFVIYKSSLSNCSSISNKKPLIELAQVFQKYLYSYCEYLSQQLNRLGDGRFQYRGEQDFHMASIILNTADYCQMNVNILEEKVKEAIDPEFKDLVSFSTEKEQFLSLIANALKCISKALENVVEPSFQLMLKTTWGNISAVGDQSEYTVLMGNELKNFVPFVRNSLLSGRYFKSICDKFAEIVTNKFYQQIFRLKLISDSGAEQLMLDSHAIKSMLLDLPGHGLGANESQQQPHSSYSKIINKGFSKSDNFLKSLMSPIDPPEGMVENYILLNADTSISQFQKLLDLKGVKKQDQPPLVDAFVRKLPTTPSGQEVTRTTTSVSASSTTSSSIFSANSGPSRFNENLRKMAANIGFKRE